MPRVFPRALVAAASLLALPAAAWEPSAPVTFAYDLDHTLLSTREGANRVYLDLRRQARDECRVLGLPSPHLDSVDRDCVAELVDKVVTAADSPALSQRHRATRLYQRARRGDAVATAHLR